MEERNYLETPLEKVEKQERKTPIYRKGGAKVKEIVTK